MTTYRSKSILITRRTFAASVLASGALGIGIGEVAAPVAPSQAQPAAVAATAPAACRTFATSVGNAFVVLGNILTDAAKYPPLVAQAYQAGLSHNSSKMTSITAQMSSTNGAILKLNGKFQAIKGPLLSEEKQCLTG
jgi:hypothetical protein